MLIKEPAGPGAPARASSSYIPTPLSTAFTQFYSRSLSSFYFHGVTFQRLVFCLVKKLCDLAVHLWSGLIVELLKLTLIQKHWRNLKRNKNT